MAIVAMRKLCLAFALLLELILPASAASIVVFWNPSTDNTGGSGVAGYNIYRNGVKIGTSTITSFTDATAVTGTSYTYTVSAFDVAGNESAQSAAASVRTGGTANVTCSGDIASALTTAISNAADGDTIVVSAGSCSIGSFVNFDNTKGATIACATIGACNISVTGNVLGMNGNLSGDNTHFYRISGFNFTTSGTTFVIWFWGNGTLEMVRIDNNTFSAPASTTLIFFGEVTSSAQFFGVVDHNTFSSAGSIAAMQFNRNNPTSQPPSPTGTRNLMFFEDNTITVTTMTDTGLGCMDIQGNFGVVWRHNTTTNCLVTSHGVTHAGGPPVIELYNNHFIANSGMDPGFQDCGRCFHHQGSGEFYAFNNSFTAFSGKSIGPISMLDYRAYTNSVDGGAPICDGSNVAAFSDGGVDGNRAPTGTNQGYPCWHQPGRDFAQSPAGGNLKPQYAWNNFWSDTLAIAPYLFEDLGGTPDYTPQHDQANRDYYTQVSASAQSSPTSPFNGTTGMGFGTLANRPTTCTTGAETGGGVGYFATDQGAQGILYRCSAVNTWTVQYTPYTYPHPLVH